ncbi:WG repeat-containing protein [Ekhidna sp.]|uniref:WG repeat-containing protein n=1 Tax=Ekhidna sp. TaxID=2608089 RepID=UPI003B50C285
MRNLISILCVLISSAIVADDFTVFEKDGYFGIKDQTGNVTVPAVYEKLGWSDGSNRVINGVIGFRRNNLWGLITARNKPLTGQKFYTIQPFDNSYIKASIKGKFSNHLFHGVLDSKGNTVISFNYFTIESIGANWLVSDFDGKNRYFGIVSFQNELIVPTKYHSITELNRFFVARKQNGKIDLFGIQGNTLELGLDSLKFNQGYLVYRDGYAGFLSTSGDLIHDFSYKTINLDNNEIKPIPFPKWTIYKNRTEIMKWECDSLTASSNKLLIAYLNGAQHLLLKNNTVLDSRDLILRDFQNNQMVVQNSKTRKWSILDKTGSAILSNYDSLFFHNHTYAALDKKGWWIFDSTGHRQTRFSLQELKRGVNDQYIAKRNNQWGILDLEKDELSVFKYDLITSANDFYLVDYLNMTGLMEQDGKWLIRPEYHEIKLFNDLFVGRKGEGYTYFNQSKPLFKSTYIPIKDLGSNLLIKSDHGYGLLNQYGELLVIPIYNEIRMIDDYYELSRNGISTLITITGNTIIDQSDNYQQVFEFGEKYFVVMKESRWGFVDEEGRLRISNRYDSARMYQNGLAPIKLREKWGFIDKNETIVVQPYYDEVYPHQNGIAIVRVGKKFGLIDLEGEEVVELNWRSIYRLETGNYIVENIEGKFGLLDKSGRFILRPSFEYLEDFGDQILVFKNGFWGILDYSGRPIFKINHKEIKVLGDLTMIKI